MQKNSLFPKSVFGQPAYLTSKPKLNSRISFHLNEIDEFEIFILFFVFFLFFHDGNSLCVDEVEVEEEENEEKNRTTTHSTNIRKQRDAMCVYIACPLIAN